MARLVGDHDADVPTKETTTMLLCEMYSPRGAHTPHQLRELAQRLTLDRLLDYYVAARGEHAEEAASANAGVLTMLGELNHVIVREIDVWVAGGEPVDSGRPRYLVRCYVPGPWRKDLSGFLIVAATAALVDGVDGQQPPRVEVQVLPVADGSYGVDGTVTGESELMALIEQAKTPAVPAAVAADAVVDPVCGMVATDPALTWEHDGITYGFCSPGCRRYFADKLRGAVVE